MAAGLSLPGSPVAVQKSGDQAGLDLILRGGRNVSRIAGVIATAIGEDVAGKYQKFSVWRNDLIGCSGSQARDLGAAGAIGIDHHDLIDAIDRSSIEDAFAIIRPARPIALGEFPGRSAINRDSPDAVKVLVLRDIGSRDSEGY